MLTPSVSGLFCFSCCSPLGMAIVYIISGRYAIRILHKSHALYTKKVQKKKREIRRKDEKTNADYTQKEWVSAVCTVFGIFEVPICEIAKLSETNWGNDKESPERGTLRALRGCISVLCGITRRKHRAHARGSTYARSAPARGRCKRSWRRKRRSRGRRPCPRAVRAGHRHRTPLPNRSAAGRS